jgi:hypothetical protein
VEILLFSRRNGAVVRIMKYSKAGPAAILALLLVSGMTLADNGYRLDYDYPNQGDDWYGGTAAPDIRRDYPALDVDAAWNGDDYGVGYDRVLDPFGFGPPLELFVGRHSSYEFRYGNLAFYGYQCWADGDCGSGSWCRADPTCEFNHCQGGSWRSCADTNPCTIDGCDSILRECTHQALLPPGEVTGLMLSRATGSTVATLTWNDRTDEDWYNVYRGEDPWLGDLTCYETSIVGTSVDDDGTIATSGMSVHLVTAEHQCGEGRLGVDSGSNLRLNTSPCP